jgi:hypothetical protein
MESMEPLILPPPEPPKEDRDSKPRVKPGDTAVLIRDWASYPRGQIVKVVKLVRGSNGPLLRYNAKAVLEGEPSEDDFFHRTFPAELLNRVPKPCETFEIFINQGMRPGWYLDVIGTQALFEYQMPAGRTYLVIEDLVTGRTRNVTKKSIPKKWRDSI